MELSNHLQPRSVSYSSNFNRQSESENENETNVMKRYLGVYNLEYFEFFETSVASVFGLQ